MAESELERYEVRSSVFVYDPVKNKWHERDGLPVFTMQRGAVEAATAALKLSRNPITERQFDGQRDGDLYESEGSGSDDTSDDDEGLKAAQQRRRAEEEVCIGLRRAGGVASGYQGGIILAGLVS